MNRDIAVERISQIKAGTFFRLKYETELPVKAVYRDLGIKITKNNEVTVRTGVKYANIDGVVPKYSQRENNYEWIIPHRISHNNKTGKDYLNVATCKHNANPHTIYKINGNEISKEDLIQRGYLIDSYWKNKDTKVMVIDLNHIENIMKGA